MYAVYWSVFFISFMILSKLHKLSLLFVPMITFAVLTWSFLLGYLPLTDTLTLCNQDISCHGFVMLVSVLCTANVSLLTPLLSGQTTQCTDPHQGMVTCGGLLCLVICFHDEGERLYTEGLLYVNSLSL